MLCSIWATFAKIGRLLTRTSGRTAVEQAHELYYLFCHGSNVAAWHDIALMLRERSNVTVCIKVIKFSEMSHYNSANLGARACVCVRERERESLRREEKERKKDRKWPSVEM